MRFYNATCFLHKSKNYTLKIYIIIYKCILYIYIYYDNRGSRILLASKYNHV